MLCTRLESAADVFVTFPLLGLSAQMGVLLAVSLVIAGIATRFEGGYRRGLNALALGLLVIAAAMLVTVPTSF